MILTYRWVFSCKFDAFFKDTVLQEHLWGKFSIYVFYFQFQVVYFTAVFPFVFLGGLLLRFLFLDGATDVGLNYMFSGRVKNNVKAICYWQMWPKAKQRFSVFLFSRDNITKLLLVFQLKILWRNLKHITAISLRSKFKFIRKVY